MLQQLLILRNLTIKSDLSTLQSGLRMLGGYRDLLAHGVWLVDENGDYYVQQISGTWKPDKEGPKVSKRITPAGVYMDAEGLQTLLQAMGMTAHLVDKVSSEVRAACAPSHQKSPPRSQPVDPPSDPTSNIP